MTAATIALVLVLIAAGLIAVGIILFLVGLAMESRERRRGAVKGQSFLDMLIELLKKLFKMIFGSARPSKKLEAFGVFLILLGIAFLIASGVSAVFAALGNPPPSSQTPTPTLEAT